MSDQAAGLPDDIRRALVVAGIGATLLLISWVLWTVSSPTAFPGRPYVLPWWAIAVARVAFASFPAVAVVRSEAVTTTLADFALIIALAFADPVDVLAGLAVGALATNLHRRQMWGKDLFNAASNVLEASVALSLVAALGVDAPAIDPRNLAVLVLAAVAANAVSYISVLTVIRAVAGEVPWLTARLAAQLGIGTALLTATGGVTVVAGLWVEPWVGVTASLFMLLLALLARFVGTATQRTHKLSMLDAAVTDLNDAPDEDQVRAELLHRARHLVGARGVALVDDPEDILLTNGIPGMAAATLDLPEDADELIQLLTAEIRERGEGVLRRRGHGLSHQAVAVPVPNGTTQPAVLIAVGTRADRDAFTSSDLHILTDLARHAGSALSQHRLVRRLREEADANDRLAHSDSLTGLPNRRGLRNYLRSGGQAAMLAHVDLARLGTLSSAFGDTVASTVVLELSARLRDVAGRGGVVARIGDRGFAVTNPERFDPAAFGRMLHDTLLRPVRVGDLRVDPEVGVGVIVAEEGDDASELLRRAAVAATMAQEQTDLGRVCVYSPEHDAQHLRRLRLTSDLRDAIAGSELQLHYQPKADLRTGSVVGVEALSRWRHPQLGPVSPVEFVDLAERAGLIGELTRWCLDTAVMDAAALDGDIPVAVNLSASDLMDPELPAVVRAALDRAGLPAEQLRVEVTESVMVEDFDRSRAVLSEIDGLGVRVSIDDFGAGYASFAHLRRLIADELKLDRSLVATLDDDGEAIVRAVVTLAGELGLHTVAEGVEDRRTWDQLVGIGVDAAQGWYLGRAMPVEGLHEWLGAYTSPVASR